MGEPDDRDQALDNQVKLGSLPSVSDRTPPGDALQLARTLLQQSIDQLLRLRQEYDQACSLLEKMWHQLAGQEAAVRRRLHEVLALMDRPAEYPARQSTLPDQTARRIALHVQTLGAFQVFLGDLTIPLGSSKKGRAILRYLVVHSRQRITKDTLAELFWPDEPSDKAVHKLHIAISTLRQGLNEVLGERLQGGSQDCIQFEEDTYSLHPSIQVELDTETFAAHYQAGEQLERQGHSLEAMAEYEAAMAIYRGDFLPEDLYADWAAGPRARLEEIYLVLLGRLADLYCRQDRYLESIAACRQILAQDSFREDAYRQLMRCYSHLGQRNQALREFQACVEVLKRELGVSPMRETAELYERIVHQEDV